jgi:hypothetical protein
MKIEALFEVTITALDEIDHGDLAEEWSDTVCASVV